MLDPIHILVTGGSGQVGQELVEAKWPGNINLHSPKRGDLDISNPASTYEFLESRSFDAVINTAAYTAVDHAEHDPVTAFAVNAVGPAVLADATRRLGIPMIQLSTDYVFDGSKYAPYEEDDSTSPISVYGASKLAGELATRCANPKSIVLRTAWVLSARRSNFLKTMLRLAVGQDVVRVVNDQYGNPTSARDLASALQTICLRMITDADTPTGTYHFVNSGQANWAGLAREIFALSADMDGPTASVEEITTDQYVTQARRPYDSRLSTEKLQHEFGIVPRPWQEAVLEILDDMGAREVEK